MHKLERFTYASLILLCAVTLGLRLEQRFRPPTQPPAPASRLFPAAYTLKGKHFEVPGLKWGPAMNAVLFVNSHCRFCDASAPFYRDIARLRRDQRGANALFAVSIDPTETTRKYLNRAGLPVDGVYQVSSDNFELHSTPTLLILDRTGTVRDVFVGMLDGEHQKEVLGIIQTGSL